MERRKINPIVQAVIQLKRRLLFNKLYKLASYHLYGMGDTYVFKVAKNQQMAAIAFPAYSMYGRRNVGSVVTFYKDQTGTWRFGNQLLRYIEKSDVYFGQDLAFSGNGSVLAISAPGYAIHRTDAVGCVFIAIFNGQKFQLENTRIDCPIGHGAVLGSSIALDASGKKLVATMDYTTDKYKKVTEVGLFIRNKGIMANPKSNVRYNLSGLLSDGLFSKRFSHTVSLDQYHSGAVHIRHQRKYESDTLYFT